MKDLDSLDRRILYELDCNSRQPISELARKLRSGRDKVEYRVSCLSQERVIRKFVASVNLCKLGFTLYKAYIRFENRKKRISDFIIKIKDHPRIYWVALCDGAWDIVLVFFALNAHEFHKIYMKIISEFSDVILNFGTYTLVNYFSYSRSHLTKLKGIRTLVGGSPYSMPIDKIDFKILRILSDESRSNAVEIENKVGVSHQVVRNRIEKMEKSGLINGYRLEIDLAKIGMLFFKTQFFIRKYSDSNREKFLGYCERHPNIITYVEQIGDSNIEIEVEVKDYEHFAEIVDEIRGEFADIIRNFQSMLIRKANRYPVPKDIPGITT